MDGERVLIEAPRQRAGRAVRSQLIAIRGEIAAIEAGKQPRQGNVLKNSPHTAAIVTAEQWSHPYTRKQAAYPLPYLEGHKFWPTVSRVDDTYGDRNLVCTCPPLEDYVK